MSRREIVTCDACGAEDGGGMTNLVLPVVEPAYPDLAPVMTRFDLCGDCVLWAFGKLYNWAMPRERERLSESILRHRRQGVAPLPPQGVDIHGGELKSR